MYLYLNNDFGIFVEDIVGIFDLDTSTGGSRITNGYLADAQARGDIVNTAGYEIPRSFIVLKDGRVYLSAINAVTLEKRAKEITFQGGNYGR